MDTARPTLTVHPLGPVYQQIVEHLIAEARRSDNHGMAEPDAVAIQPLTPSCPICGEPVARPPDADVPPSPAWFAVECGRGPAPHWAGRGRFWTRQTDEPAPVP